jgi:hypothetical protein
MGVCVLRVPRAGPCSEMHMLYLVRCGVKGALDGIASWQHSCSGAHKDVNTPEHHTHETGGLARVVLVGRRLHARSGAGRKAPICLL